MSIDTSQLSDEGKLDILTKYKVELDYLKRGRERIVASMTEDKYGNEVINKKLEKLSKSIEYLENGIKELEKALTDLNNKMDNVAASLNDI